MRCNTRREIRGNCENLGNSRVAPEFEDTPEQHGEGVAVTVNTRKETSKARRPQESRPQRDSGWREWNRKDDKNVVRLTELVQANGRDPCPEAPRYRQAYPGPLLLPQLLWA